MKKESSFPLALLFVLLLCLGVTLGVLAARWNKGRETAAPAEETSEPAATAALTPAPTKAPPPSVASEECGHPLYENGVCVLCGHVCEHPFHSTEGECLLCGAKVVHHYVHGVCACGRTPDLYTTVLPERFYQPCEQEGVIVEWAYETEVWGVGAKAIENVDFYIPYGYTPLRQYNVLVLLHGLRTTENSWLNETHELLDGRFFEMRWIYDHMIEEKIIEPLIIVSASQYLVTDNNMYKTSYEQMAEELQRRILPYTVGFLSTYAEGDSEAALIRAREHFALGGNSWGSYYTYDTGMCQSLPYFASFLCFSGDAAGAYIIESLEAERVKDYDVKLYYAAAGNVDVARAGEEGIFYSVVPRTSKLTDMENAFFHICEGGHDWNTWSIEIYNALQFLFA